MCRRRVHLCMCVCVCMYVCMYVCDNAIAWQGVGGVGWGGVSVCPRCIISLIIITLIITLITTIIVISMSLVLQVFRLDEVASYQRSAVYSQRRAFLTSSDDGRPHTHIHTLCIIATNPARP